MGIPKGVGYERLVTALRCTEAKLGAVTRRVIIKDLERIVNIVMKGMY